MAGGINLCRDHKDNMVLETAIKGEVDYLLTRDDDIKLDLNLISEMNKQNIKVVTVSQFLEMFDK